MNNNEQQDKHLQTPQESNTEKHINFREIEDGDAPSTEAGRDDNSDSPTRKAWEELRKDNEQK
jgi:hypothetical protein